ncbi:hypoxanthine phosphoribosyltransferase [uncultured Fibrobacter sp.]|uniref:hypoxanthine phosphoribosyltransferase n=1 Tax=uncultured Fibrobacter sp. TaxID=261512 RepID=UPI00262A639D|nr:hypoxanthine phosphoribosyltransferase [uncultured Fibrobacter sp.]
MYKMSEKPLISEKRIRERVSTLAQEIVVAYDFDILLSALTGAYMFTADLCREIARVQGPAAIQKRIAFIKASSYGDSTESSGKLQVQGLERINLQGKKVLMIDDIADTGTTLLGLLDMLKNAGAKEVRTCVLLNKQERREVNVTADFVGFEIANEFVVGYGLDYANDYRMLPEIWTLQEAN